MPDENRREVFRALREGQNRYCYILLAASGGAIALAVNQTADAALSWSQIPLGAAVLCWGLSFFCGCRHIAYVNSALYANAELIKVEGGNHPEVGANPSFIYAASDGIRRAIEANSDRSNRSASWQFRWLVIGAVFYIMWHIIEMYMRTYPAM